jgi:hypothetical protein
MNQTLRISLLLLMFVPTIGFTDPLTNGNYWQCVTHDKTNKVWTAQSAYQKMAINIAFAACKKESQHPTTCKTAVVDCEGFNQGVSTKPMWRCTALDRAAQPWKSDFYPQQDDAALGAKAYCKDNSTVPDTCYVNLVTCRNVNEAHQL